MIDISQLSSLITALRNETQSEAITPESLGELLQQIANLLASAGTSEDVSRVTRALAEVNDYVSGIQVNIQELTGEVSNIDSSLEKVEQKVADNSQKIASFNSVANTVNGLKENVQNLIESMETLGSSLDEVEQQASDCKDELSALSAKVDDAGLKQIFCEIVDKKLYVRGTSSLVDQGFVPYLFRYSKKRNRYNNTLIGGERGHSDVKKGWNRMGGHLSLKVNEDGLVTFNKSDHSQWHLPIFCPLMKDDYSHLPEYLVDEKSRSVGWGISTIKLEDRRTEKPRLVKLRFGIAFVKTVLGQRQKLHLDALKTNIAEFYVVHNRNRFDNPDAWRFTK